MQEYHNCHGGIIMSGFTTATAIAAIGTGISAISTIAGLFGGKGAGNPAAPPAPPPSAAPASLASSTQSVSNESARLRAIGGAAGGGFDNTVATSPLGASAPTTAKTGLLGTS